MADISNRPYTDTAATMLAGTLRSKYNQAFPIADIIAVILQLLPFLSTICGKKTPESAVSYLNWKPWFWLPFGYYTYDRQVNRFRNGIESTANASSAIAISQEVWSSIWSRIDDGEFNKDMATGLYRELVPGYR